MAIILAIIGIVVVSCIYETLFKSGSVNDIKKAIAGIYLRKLSQIEIQQKKHY